MHFTDMEFIPIGLFLLFLGFLIANGFSKKNKAEWFYNAGGNLPWFAICASIMGANITFEYILSSAGNGFTTGLAFASFEWGASFVIIFTALYFIPKFMQIGILTLPEYLEYRYNKTSRVLTAILFLLTQFGMLIPILVANALFMEKLFGVSQPVTIIVIALISGTIIFSGGLYSKIRLDMVVFVLFIISAFIVLFYCFIYTDGIQYFMENAHGRLKVVLPKDHPVVPWTSVLIGGLWILHVHYWTFFQPIAQSALASNSLSETQKGYLSAATLKLITPFLMIIPGIVAYELFEKEITSPDLTLPTLISRIIPSGLKGIIAVGYLGTMFSTYVSYLNATANVCSLDIIQPLVSVRDKEKSLYITRICIAVFVVLSVIAAISFVPDGALFNYTQIIFACVTPISTSVFLFGIFSRKTPSIAAIVVLLTGIPLFFILKNHVDISVINLSGLVFIILFCMMGLIRLIFPMKDAIVLPEKFNVKFERNLAVIIWSIFLLTCVFCLYTIFI